MAPSFNKAEAEWSCHRLPLRIAASGTTLTDRSGFYFILSDIVFILHCCAFTMSQCLYCFRVWWDGRFRSSNEYLNLLAKSRDPRGQFLTPGASLLACFPDTLALLTVNCLDQVFPANWNKPEQGMLENEQECGPQYPPLQMECQFLHIWNPPLGGFNPSHPHCHTAAMKTEKPWKILARCWIALV